MAITHSTAADGSFTGAGATAWDADHTVADNTFVAAKLSATGTDIVFGRSAAGAGAGEEIAVTAAGRAILDDATAAAQATTLGLGTGDSPQFTAVNIGHATDTTLTRPSAGDVSVEGNIIYRAGGTDVAVADGGTGASVVQTARENLGSQGIIVCTSNPVAFNPADATTYFFGVVGAINAVDYNRIYFKTACHIKEVRLAVIVLGTLGTTEQATVSLRLNNTTDTTVSSVVQYNVATPVRFDNTALDIAIAAGDFIEMKVVMPTFTTNPTSVHHIVEIIYQ